MWLVASSSIMRAEFRVQEHGLFFKVKINIQTGKCYLLVYELVVAAQI